MGATPACIESGAVRAESRVCYLRRESVENEGLKMFEEEEPWPVLVCSVRSGNHRAVSAGDRWGAF